MSGIKPELLELIHADIDGVIGEQDRERLRSELDRDSEARALHQDLQSMNAAFEELGQLEVPMGVVKEVVDSTKPKRSSGQRWSIAYLFSMPALRYALAFLFGAILAGGVMQMRPIDHAVEDLAALPGAMIPMESVRPVKTVKLSADTLSGTVKAYAGELGLRVDFAVSATQPTELVLTPKSGGTELRAFRQSEGQLDKLQTGENRIRAEFNGSQKFSILLSTEGAAKPQVRLSLTQGETRIHRSVIRTEKKVKDS